MAGYPFARMALRQWEADLKKVRLRRKAKRLHRKEKEAETLRPWKRGRLTATNPEAERLATLENQIQRLRYELTAETFT